MRVNVPGTADTPGNLKGGVLIVLPPAFGPIVNEDDLPPEPKAREAFLARMTRKRGLITAARIDRGPEIQQALRWLAAAGFPVAEQAERFSILNWPTVWDGRPRDAHVIREAVTEGKRLVDVIEKRRPILVVFLSSQLLEAANDPALIERLASSIGLPLQPACRLSDMRLRILGQRWKRALMVGLPMPRRTMSMAQSEEISSSLRKFFAREGLL
ncbi:hypothetical protein [Sutterella sp.]|uniref:hypothetical protein n=1 Tax=Sutterella sp. TaxID=1981025 RepID=UPI0026E075F2|nr:hypothetical protein [Sutterella sp.]MDO5531304.1 hypothetical protein [Sutterella sp.]